MMRIGKRIRERIGWLRRRHALRIAVKEALDTLPTAVCYFHPSGTVKLCNRAMEDLFRTITGRDLQSFGELQKALAHCNSASGIVRDGNVSASQYLGIHCPLLGISAYLPYIPATSSQRDAVRGRRG